MCDVTQITSTTMSWEKNNLLSLLLSALDCEPEELTSQCAGYFSRAFQLLSRRHPKLMMKYWEERGPELMKPFLKHLGSYSIMEALQCILNLHVEATLMDCDSQHDPMSPMTPASGDKDGEDDSKSNGEKNAVSWMQSAVVITELIDCLTRTNDEDVHDNVAIVLESFCGTDMLPRNEALLTHLESQESCAKLLRIVAGESRGDAESSKVDGDDDDEPVSKTSSPAFEFHAVDGSARVAALQTICNILDAFMMRQHQPEEDHVGSAFLSDPMLDDHNMGVGNHGAKLNLTAEQPPALEVIWEHASDLRSILCDSRFRIQKQSDGVARPRVGRARRLTVQIVTHVVVMASTVFTGEARKVVCDNVCKSGLVSPCFDLFFRFDRCNILHNFVIDMLMHIVTRTHMDVVSADLFRSNESEGENSYDLLRRVLKEYDVNTKIRGMKDRKDSCAKSNYGHLHRISNIIVEASQLPSEGKDDDTNVMAAPPSLLRAVKESDEWNTFTSGELQRINKENGTSTAQTPGMDSVGEIQSPENDTHGNDDDDWHLHDVDVPVDQMRDAHIDDHLSEEDSSSDEGEAGTMDTNTTAQISSEGNDDEEDEDDTGWANFDNFEEESSPTTGDSPSQREPTLAEAFGAN